MSRNRDYFRSSKDELDGGYSATALAFSIHIQGEVIDELRHSVREAVDYNFDKTMGQPNLIRLHFVRDELL